MGEINGGSNSLLANQFFMQIKKLNTINQNAFANIFITIMKLHIVNKKKIS